MSNVRQGVIDVIAAVSGRPAASIRPDQDLVADLAIDSPKALQLLIEIEEKLGIEISDEEAEELDTVGDVLALVDAGG